MISGQCENLMIFKHWRFFMISGQCENLMIYKHFDGFSWFLGNPGQCENLMIFKYFDSFSWFLGNVKISWFSNTLTVFHDFWAMWKSDDFLYFLTVFQYWPGSRAERPILSSAPRGGGDVICMFGWIFRGRATASATALLGPWPYSSFVRRSLRPSSWGHRSGLRPWIGRCQHRLQHQERGIVFAAKWSPWA